MSDRAPAARLEDPAGDLLLLEQVNYLYLQLGRSTLGMVVAATIMAYAMWDKVAFGLVIYWFGAIALNQTWRYSRYLEFKNHPPPARDARGWARHWAVGAGISGALWGSTAFFMFVPDSPGHQAFLAAALIGVTAGALALITMHKTSFYAFVIPTLLPITLRLVYEGDRLHAALALACFTVFVSALMFGNKLNDKLTQTIRLRLLLDAATHEKSEFLAATAHDIGNQATLLKQHTKRIAAFARNDEEALVVDDLAATVSSLQGMVSQLRQFSEIESGILEPRFSAVRVQDLFDVLLREFKPLADARGLRLTVLDSGAAIRSDLSFLQRMVWNLVGNAIHYTREGGVLVGARVRGERVRIEIYDTGVGIAEADRERIFEKFRRAESAEKSDHQGMGLGLANVRGFAARLGHEIELKSVPGRGSRFTIVAPAAAPEPVKSAATDDPESSDLAGHRVVLIDDDTEVLQQVTTILRGWGCEVIAAATPDEALAGMGTQVPALVVSDYALSGNTTGFHAIERIWRAAGTRVPALLISGTARSRFADEAKARRLEVLQKPVDAARLRSAVLRCLAQRAGEP